MNDSLELIHIPVNVKEALKTAFPSVDETKVEWSWEVYNKIYEAEFETEGAEYEVEITVTGHHLLTEKEIKVEEVPANIVEAVKEKYPTQNISEAEIVTWSTGEVFYELDLSDEKGEEECEIHVNEAGEITALGEDL